LFAFGHATHPQWGMAAALVLAQLRALLARPDHAGAPNLGLLYITDHYAEHAQELIDYLSAELPQVLDWAGTVGVGIASNNVEYFDEPALAVMLCELPADQYRVFSGVAPLGASGSGFAAHTALVHADPGEPELAELIAELAQRTRSGYLFGGLAASRGQVVQFAQSGRGHMRGQGAAGSVFAGGFSGVAFGPEVALISRVTQGCQPIAAERTITACDGHVVIELDGQPALEVLLADLQVSLDEPQTALAKVRRTLVGLRPAAEVGEGKRRTGPFGADTLVRHIIGLDPARHAVAVAQATEPGMRLSFCERHAAAAMCVPIGVDLRHAAGHADSHVGGAGEAEAGQVIAGAIDRIDHRGHRRFRHHIPHQPHRAFLEQAGQRTALAFDHAAFGVWRVVADPGQPHRGAR
jgi:small ligand-binding sensory domain FIST